MKPFIPYLLLFVFLVSCENDITRPYNSDQFEVWTDRDYYVIRTNGKSDSISIYAYNGLDNTITYYNPLYMFFLKENDSWIETTHCDLASPGDIEPGETRKFTSYLGYYEYFPSDTFKLRVNYTLATQVDYGHSFTNEFLITVE